MADVSTTRSDSWKPTQVIALCAVCAIVGLLFGYLLRGSAPKTTVPSATPTEQAAAQMPSLDQMKHMADKKAEPLLEKLKSDPQNIQLLNEVGLLYKAAHQFPQAAEYFKKALDLDKKNIATRADYATCLYYGGDTDGALAALNESLTYDPKHAGTLMNIGIIKWKGKNDVKGAVDSWQKLLKYHPDYPQKAEVENMISEAERSRTAAPAPGKG